MKITKSVEKVPSHISKLSNPVKRKPYSLTNPSFTYSDAWTPESCRKPIQGNHILYQEVKAKPGRKKTQRKIIQTHRITSYTTHYCSQPSQPAQIKSIIHSSANPSTPPNHSPNPAPGTYTPPLYKPYQPPP